MVKKYQTNQYLLKKKTASRPQTISEHFVYYIFIFFFKPELFFNSVIYLITPPPHTHTDTAWLLKPTAVIVINVAIAQCVIIISMFKPCKTVSRRMRIIYIVLKRLIPAICESILTV